MKYCYIQRYWPSNNSQYHLLNKIIYHDYGVTFAGGIACKGYKFLFQSDPRFVWQIRALISSLVILDYKCIESEKYRVFLLDS